MARHSGIDPSKLSPAMQAQVAAQLYPRHCPARAIPCDSDGPGGIPTPPKAGKAVKTPGKRVGGRVPRTRNGGKWTEAAYWGALRSALRRLFRFWAPAQAALKAARVPCSRGRQKMAYLCAACGKVYRRSCVQIDHVEPCGALTSLADLPEFVRRLTPEAPEAYQVVCVSCHQAKTTAERQKL